MVEQDATPEVRSARDEDVPALTALMATLGYPADEETIRGRLRRIEAHPDHHTLVAEADGTVVGMVGVMRGLAWDKDSYARIIALVVDPAWRGRGAGAALVRAAEDWAREAGATSIHLTAAHRREGAHRFYERMGYEHTGRRYVRPLE